MKNIKFLFVTILASFVLFSCNKAEDKVAEDTQMNEKTKLLKERIDIFAPTKIGADISYLTDNQKKVIEILVKAAKLADEVFWKQTGIDAIPIRDSLAALNTEDAKIALEFVKINYGPYDLIEEGKRMLGNGPAKKPAVANFYPQDMTREEFENYVAANPEEKAALESYYTIVRREGNLLKAIPYHEAYPEQMQIADLLDEAADYTDNPGLKNYFIKKAIGLRHDNYFDSDMAWMDISDNDIDLIIGPTENYEDAMFNYKTAYEAVVFVRDREASKELQMFKSHIEEFEKRLPSDKKYIRKSVGGGEHILNIVNVLYFAGDCQAGTKTIACNLPNDPAVRQVKGGKNTMYKNMMEAKFDKIVVPIGNEILDASIAGLVDKKCFMSFVTLHEISHTLGRDYVFGHDDLPVRKAMKERYSAIEECKADILSMCNHKALIDMGIWTEDYGRKAMATYIAGLYRSLRFGAEEAHGKANIIQLNFLREKGAITVGKDGKFNIDEKIFFEKCAELAKIVLEIEATGNYEAAGKLLADYGQINDEIKSNIDKLKNIPRDLNTSYEF